MEYSKPKKKLRDISPIKNIEETAYKDGEIMMHRGGWVAIRNGKMIGTRSPSEQDAKHAIDSTRQTVAKKILDMIRKPTRKVAAESAEARKQIRSWDSAVVKGSGLSLRPKFSVTNRTMKLLRKAIKRVKIKRQKIEEFSIHRDREFNIIDGSNE